ncbi:MAG TPA: signal peptidase I [Chloroflexota bacterium]
MDHSEHVSEAVAPASPPPLTSGGPPPAAPTASRAGKKSRARGALREVIETLILTAVIFLGVRVLVQNYKVEGYSMEPTLDDGQYLLINKVGMHFHQPERGDIIVFQYPLDPSKSFVKRVIGVPGDTVEVRDQQTIVDGKVLKEPYLGGPENGFYPRTVVPPSEYFVLGDNRNNSSDSRAWGMLPQKDVIGLAWVSYWPPNRWSAVREYRYPELASASSSNP